MLLHYVTLICGIINPIIYVCFFTVAFCEKTKSVGDVAGTSIGAGTIVLIVAAVLWIAEIFCESKVVEETAARSTDYFEANIEDNQLVQ